MNTAPDLVLEGDTVDVISPFPVAHAHRVWGWTRSSGVNTQLSYPWEDDLNEHAFIERVMQQLDSPDIISFGLIDKTGDIDAKVSLPIIGMILVDYQSATLAYTHIAGRRKAAKQIREAARIVRTYAFESNDRLQYLNALISSKNVPALQVAREAGLEEDFKVSHLSLSRGNFECHQQQYHLSNQQSDSQQEPLERQEETPQRATNKVSLKEPSLEPSLAIS